MTQLPAAARDQQMREAATVPVQLYACDRCGTVGIEVPKFDPRLRDWPSCERLTELHGMFVGRCHGTMQPIAAVLSPVTP